jgi:hypothetical protein
MGTFFSISMSLSYSTARASGDSSRGFSPYRPKVRYRCSEGGKIFGKITGLTEPTERIGNINALQRRAPHSS